MRQYELLLASHDVVWCHGATPQHAARNYVEKHPSATVVASRRWRETNVVLPFSPAPQALRLLTGTRGQA